MIKINDFEIYPKCGPDICYVCYLGGLFSGKNYEETKYFSSKEEAVSYCISYYANLNQPVSIDYSKDEHYRVEQLSLF